MVFRAGRIELSYEFLKQILTGEAFNSTSNVPDDIQVFGVEWDSNRAVVRFSFTSKDEKIPVVAEGATIPVYNTAYIRKTET